MKPIRIFTHATCEPPGYLAKLFDRLNYTYEYFCLNDGETVPMNLHNVAALVFMGGPGDVNHPSNWMKQEIALIKQANSTGIPVLGICLGAQLMSKALGGEVWQTDELEVGWHDVRLLRAIEAQFLLDDLPDKFSVFQWHAHAFSPPSGALTIATSDCTDCQAYIYRQNLALQFHLEMDENIIRTLIDTYRSDLEGHSHCVQHHEQILEGITEKCNKAFAIADSLLTPWLVSVIVSEPKED